jgi:hypothetical protein
MNLDGFYMYWLDVVSTNILPSFRADYSSKEGAVETSISEIFGGKSLDITTRF